VRLIVLGTGAGGGCPQWNCGCENCNFARNNPQSARTTDSLAVEYESDGRQAWAIVNPGVDLRHQLARHSELQPPKDGQVRDTPIKSVILTDAELDHTMGLINLREGSQLEILATPSVLELLESRFPLKTVLKNYANLTFRTIVPGTSFLLGNSLRVEAAGLSGRQPKYAQEAGQSANEVAGTDAVIGLRFESPDTESSGRSCKGSHSIAYAPQIGAWSQELISLLDGCYAVLVDGTFYTSNELQCLGVKAPSAEQMGHLPLSGRDGILSRLENINARIKLLTHINNTNPILRDNSSQRQAVENAGVKIAVDGMSVCSGASYASTYSTKPATKNQGKIRD